MKKLLITLISAITLGTTLPVLAGPDWQAIERARKAKQATQAAGQGDARPAAGTEGMTCPLNALALSLDHGPRAQSTPYLNEKHKARFEAEQKACNEAAGKEAIK